MTTFSEYTLQVLTKAGWSEDYTANNSIYRELLESEGYTVLEKAMQFLNRYGGLVLTYAHRKISGETATTHFDISRAIKRVEVNDLLYYSQALQKKLCLIGETSSGYMVLMMDQNGVVYAGIDDLLYLVGETGEASINNIISGGNFKLIHSEG